jgi:hypothetical protein
MSRPFIPPAVAALGEGPAAEQARAVMRAREAGYADGHAAGLREGHDAGAAEGAAQARASADVEIAALRAARRGEDAAGAVTVALERVLAVRRADLDALETATRAAVTAALRTLLPCLLGSAAGQEVAALAAAALTEREEAALTLRASPDTIAALPGGPDPRLIVLPDPAMGRGAADIGWTGGGLRFDPETLLRRVTALLDPYAFPEPLLAPASTEDLPA